MDKICTGARSVMSVRGVSLGVWRGALCPPGTNGMLGTGVRSGDCGDRHTSMPELRFQFRSHIPRCVARRDRYHSGCLRTLPLHPVVLTSQLNSDEGRNLDGGGPPGGGFQQSHWSDLNRRPLDYESRALPLSYSGGTSECPGADSNRDAFRHYPLKIACLPVSPPGRASGAR